MQAILLREAFCRFAQQGVAIKQNAPTVILDVSCGPGDYSVVWTSHVARFLPVGIAFYCTDYRGGVSRETGQTYAMTTAKKMQAAAENGKLRLAQAPVATDADLLSGHDALMPAGKTADIGASLSFERVPAKVPSPSPLQSLIIPPVPLSPSRRPD